MLKLWLIFVFIFLCFPIESVKHTEFIFFPLQLSNCLVEFNSTQSDFIELLKDNRSNSKKNEEKFYVNTNQVEQIKYIYNGRVNVCFEGGCPLNANITEKSNKELQREYFDYFILFDSVPSVKKVVVYNYQATYGQEIISADWLSQFNEYNENMFLFVGEEIDAITGATTSVDALTDDLQLKTKKLCKIIMKHRESLLLQ